MELKEYGGIGESVCYDTLPNGLRLIVVKKPDFKKSMAFFATHYGGSMRRFQVGGEWRDTPAGVAHFLEHKLFDLENGENALTVLSKRGASANAFTSSDMTAYHFESVDQFDENLDLLLRFVSVPYFTEASVRKEQGIIGQEIRMTEDDPDYAVYYALLEKLFAHNPVRESVAGTVESIAGITADTLYQCHGAFYRPSNMALVAVCGESAEKIRDMAAAALPRNPAPAPVVDFGAAESEKPAGRHAERVMAVGSPMFLAGVKTGPDLRGKASAKLELTAGLALSTLMGRASPLYSRLYSAGLINDTFSYEFEISSGVSFLTFGGESRDPQAVFSAVLEEAGRFAAGGCGRELFERRKKSAYGHALRALNSFDSVCYNVANAAFSGYDFFETAGMLASITPEEAMGFVGKYLTPERAAVSIVHGQEK